MPEKRNENKIMQMLERTGVLRKVGDEDGSFDTDDGSQRNGSDIKPIFDPPEDLVKVTPAARQPVPGMINPVFPAEKTADEEYEQPQSAASYEPESAITEEAPVPEPELYVPPSELPVAPEPEPSQKQPMSFGGLNIFRNGNAPEETAAPSSSMQREGQPDNYTDRYLNTEELYEALALRSKKTDSIYLIEEYLATLPPSLPDSMRREIVNKLIAASGFDYDMLMGDGVLRVKMLKEYAERFARHTDDYVAARQAELDEMDQQILRTRRLIENRKDLHKKQFMSIEAEAQRLKEILTFISG